MKEQLSRRKSSKSTLIGLLFIHAGACAAIPFFTWGGLATALVLYVLIGCLGVCVGYHRLFTHGSFKTYRPVRWVFAILGSLSGQTSIIQWVAQHRQHHKHSDTEADPHSPRDGVWWAHMLWFLPRISRTEMQCIYQTYAPDLLKERSMRFINWSYMLWHGILALLLFLPAMLVWDWTVGLSLVLWGMFVRMVLMYHATWAVNSLSHMWGYRNYQTKDLSRNNLMVAVVAFGEGWHNNHHQFPTLAKHGHHRWWELDPSYWAICLLALSGLAWDVKRHIPAESL